jgi:hypothetical protein
MERSGVATQLIINCHGGYSPKDGYTTVPTGTTLFFYTRHGNYTNGSSVYSEVMANPVDAAVGLPQTIARLNATLQPLAAGAGVSIAQVQQMSGLTKDSLFTSYDSFGGGQPMYDYALSNEDDAARLTAWDNKLRDHALQAGSQDIDLLMLAGPSAKLSDVFEATAGMGYRVIHVGFCRAT